MCGVCLQVADVDKKYILTQVRALNADSHDRLCVVLCTHKKGLIKSVDSGSCSIVNLVFLVPIAVSSTLQCITYLMHY